MEADDLNQVRHERSKRDFPNLKLEDDEYVELAYSRAPICLFLIWLAAGGSLILVLGIFLLAIVSQPHFTSLNSQFVFLILFALIATIFLVALIATSIFRHNKIYITNRRVIQFIMKTPVATSSNFIDLFSIEDVSFHQNTILQKLFGYGTIRLATVGNETTYTFTQALDPKDDINLITRLIRDAKDTRAALSKAN